MQVVVVILTIYPALMTLIYFQNLAIQPAIEGIRLENNTNPAEIQVGIEVIENPGAIIDCPTAANHHFSLGE